MKKTTRTIKPGDAMVASILVPGDDVVAPDSASPATLVLSGTIAKAGDCLINARTKKNMKVVSAENRAMDLQKFKDKLEKQGVSWNASSTFTWYAAPEGYRFWRGVTHEAHKKHEPSASKRGGPRECESCDWVDVGFTTPRMVCRHCDREKGQ